MAKVRVFTVYDSKVGAYAAPFCMRSKGEALRSWIDVVNDPKTAFSKHPEDFCLFEVAEYDEDTGQFSNHPAPVSLGVGVEFHKGYPNSVVPSPEAVLRMQEPS